MLEPCHQPELQVVVQLPNKPTAPLSWHVHLLQQKQQANEHTCQVLGS